MMAGLGRRVQRLEEAAKPKSERVAILVILVAPDGSKSGPFTYGEGGTLRPPTEAEMAAGEPDVAIEVREGFAEPGENDGAAR